MSWYIKFFTNFYVGGTIVIGGFYAIFVAKWGWGDGSIVMGALLVGASIITGLGYQLFKKKDK